MKRLRILTASEQVTDHLRHELLKGTWSEVMPGADCLASRLGVGIHTVAEALKQLERAGLLVGKGHRHRRRIVQTGQVATPSLRVAILDYEPPVPSTGYMLELRYLLENAGHTAFFARKSLQDLGMDVRRVARLVAKTEADTWIICAGSREVLEWFAARPVPAFALFGRRGNVPLAGVGPDHMSANLAVVRRLLELGHRRIVILARRERLAGGPGSIERAMLDELAAHGIKTSSYNLPDWENTREGFHQVLDELYRVTPPSALILDEAYHFAAAKQHLAHRGILAPQHVSLVSASPDPTFAWCQPTIAHIHYDFRPVLKRVVRWADNVARSRDDRRQTLTKAVFVEGGTIGPARGAIHP
jgi:DNA-binding LacI/PurR family transcriptional regulator